MYNIQNITDHSKNYNDDTIYFNDNLSLKKFIFSENTKKIIFNGRYNMCFCGVIFPPSLEELELSGDFNQPINCMEFPKNLKSLKFGINYEQPLDDIKFPNNLEKIIFYNAIDEISGDIKLPKNLKEITFGNCIDTNIILPIGIKKITFDLESYYHMQYYPDYLLEKVIMPDNIDQIIFNNGRSNVSKLKFPPNVKQINFYGNYNNLIDDLPENLEILCLWIIDYPIINLPINLKKIFILNVNPLEKIKELIKLPFGCVIYKPRSEYKNNASFDESQFFKFECVS